MVAITRTIAILLFLAIIGHALKRIELNRRIKRMNFTLEYRNKFEFVNGFTEHGRHWLKRFLSKGYHLQLVLGF